MIDRRGRPFSIGDAMILVAAMAVAFGWLSAQPTGYYLQAPLDVIAKSARVEFTVINLYPAWKFVAWKYRDRAEPVVIPFATAATLAFLAIRLRRPRPGRRRLFRQPGMIALSSASAVILLNAAGASVQRALCGLGLSSLTDPRYYANPAFLGHLIGTPETIGAAVFAAGAILAIGGRRRPEPGWIDRSGRALGAIWLALWLLDWLAWRLR